MAWSKKTWTQRIVENAGRRLLTSTTKANVFDITRSEGTVIQAGDGFTVSNMNDLENRIDSGFTDVNTRLKPATVGAKQVVATSITAGQVFTAPVDGEYQIRASFSSIAGYIAITHSNGQKPQINAAATPNYGQPISIKVNSGQTITMSAINLITSVEVAFFPQI